MSSAVSFMKFDGLTLQRLLRRKAVERGILVLKVAFAFIILACLAKLIAEAVDNSMATGTAITALETEVKAATLNVAPAQDQKGTRPDYSQIVRSNLFGPLQAVQVAQPVQTTSKPVNKMPLALVGVFLTEGETPSAIIEDEKKKTQDVFVLGEMVFGEAKLVSVLPDRVEIERFGAREVLAMDESADTTTATDFKDGVAMVSDTEYIVQEQELDKNLENLPLLLTQARAVPYFKDGQSVGLRLFAVKPGSLFERIGLKNGDILKSINGNTLGDLSQAIKLFETLKQEKSISVSMERDRTEKEVRYQIR